MGVLLRILGMRCEAEDALQEIFSRVWLKAAMYDAAKGRGMTWLICMARNHAIDRIRVRPRTVSDSAALEALIDTTPSAESCMIAKGQASQIRVCLDCLAPDRAAMLRGAYLDGHSYLELAHRFDMPLNTVRTILRRSLQKVRRCMEESPI
ncbi:MAG: sigma-70 family RNA polymerase sigma factor [Candidatus Saccharibacteria bacterium]|nr:sigma-70 family RNA polymerase sigma factor [Pseudorhodobacter sp.]